MKLSFYGVRGSCPSVSRTTARYGGNTSSVVLEAPGNPPLLLDLGTGVAAVGREWPHEESFSGAALVTHLHYDHVLGLPFLEPINQPGAHLEIYGPDQRGSSLAHSFAALVRPPYFPLHLGDLRGRLSFVELSNDTFWIGAIQVVSRLIPHLGPTLGYRVECGGKVLAYLSDHQAPPDLEEVADSVLELCEGVDVLIHDAQYTRSEFLAKPDWGHSTVDYAVRVAARAGVRQLCLFHHDPSHTDEELDGMLESVRPAADAAGVPVLSAAEGLTINL